MPVLSGLHCIWMSSLHLSALRVYAGPGYTSIMVLSQP